MKLSYEARRGFAISFLVIIFSVLFWMLGSVIVRTENRKDSCEEAGGHIYIRTVGKSYYTKCVTDNDEVIKL